MERRTFLKNTGKIISLGSILPGFVFTALPSNTAFGALMAGAQENDNVLVLIQLNGGNDGLNTIIPIDQYSALSNARSNILIPENKVLKLKGFDKTGLHPSMQELQTLFNEDKFSIIQNVGYPNQNFSHFRSTGIWMSGSDSNEVLNTGWLGRTLNHEFPNFPNGFPNTEMPDPLAIQIGFTVSTVFQGPTVPMAVSLADPDSFYELVNDTYAPTNNNAIGKELLYVRTIMRQANAYNTVIKKAADQVKQQSTYPSGNPLADQLKIVAKLIKGGLKTKIYMVSIGGFDTHASQVDQADTTKGDHATLLSRLSQAIYAFQNDLKFLGIENRVIGMTMSEFGRRVKSNGSMGTDHGAALPMMLFGTQIEKGIFGKNPTIPDNATENDNIPMHYDFRSVYASILNQWFCIPPDQIKNILFKDFQNIPIVKSQGCHSEILERNKRIGNNYVVVYPNPFEDKINIKFESEGGLCILQIFDNQGKIIKQHEILKTSIGQNECNIYFDHLASGIYYLRYQNKDLFQVKTIFKVDD
jgi:uncharacterized protein (DUF1501 family)